MTTLLLDSDILAYRESATGELRIDWEGDGDIDTIPDDFENITGRVDRAIARLVDTLKAKRVIVCLSCDRKDNWRKDYYPQYKENRAGAVKPLHLMAAKGYMAREYETYERPRLEADDVLGILSTHPTKIPGKRIIVSEDKDMKTVPGWLFNPDKDRVARLVDRNEADHFHMLQTLMGDPTDGYPGCPGIGPKKAEAALLGLSTYQELWPAVVSAYEGQMAKHYSVFDLGPEAEKAALVQARISRICRHTDYNYSTKEVIPWTPPKE